MSAIIGTTRLLQKINDIKEQFGQITDTNILERLNNARYNWIECVSLSPEIVRYFVKSVECNLFDGIVTNSGIRYSNFSCFNLSGFRKTEAFLSAITEYQKLNFSEVLQQAEIDNICATVYLLIGGKKMEDFQYSLMSSYRDLNFFPKTDIEKIRLINYNTERTNLETANELYQRINPNFKRSGFYSDVEKIKDELGLEYPLKRLNVDLSHQLLNIMKQDEYYTIRSDN